MPAYDIDDSRLLFEGEAILKDVPSGLSISPDFPADEGGTIEETGGVFITANADGAAARHMFDLGQLVDCNRYAGGYRYSIWWMRPAVGDDVSSLPAETQYVYFRRNDGKLVLLLSLIDGPFRSAFKGSEGGVLQAVAQTGDEGVTGDEAAVAYLIVGDDPFGMMSYAASAVIDRVGLGRHRIEKRVPEAMKYFGWCTWDAFYQEVSHENVRKGLQTFRDAGVEPRFMILDDGWQSVRPVGHDGKQRVLSAFEANEKFPGDLQETVDMAKGDFAIEHFYVWHAVQGYWSGVDEKLEKYGSCMTKKQWSDEVEAMRPGINEEDIPAAIVPPDKAFLFFKDYYRHLREQGVDGVKVDSQCVLEACGMGHGGRTAMMRAYHEAFEGAAAIHLEGNIINCMCGSNDMSYSAIVSNVARTSNDFMPKQPHSHGLHIWQNAFTSLFVGEFAMPDWDMFHSASEFGAFHAMARAISGGPVYVSDKPGEHDAEVLRKLVLSGGRLPMCTEIARPMAHELFNDPMTDDVLLKLVNANEQSFVIGLFNVHSKTEDGGDGKSITDKLSPQDIFSMGDELDAGLQAAIYLHNAQAMAIVDWNEAIEVQLEPLTADLATVVVVEDGFAAIGLVNKYNSGGTFEAIEAGDGQRFIHVMGSGTFLAYCEQEPELVLVDGVPAVCEYDADAGTLVIELDADEDEEWDEELAFVIQIQL